MAGMDAGLNRIHACQFLFDTFGMLTTCLHSDVKVLEGIHKELEEEYSMKILRR